MGWLLLGMQNYLYESTNGGDDWTRVSSALPGAPSALAYGGMLNGQANPSVAYVGVGGTQAHLYLRTAAGGTFNAVNAYTGERPGRSRWTPTTGCERISPIRTGGSG